MHRLRSIVTTKNLQNLTYDYDKFGNLAARKDWKANMEETFTYDDMNRLTGVTLKRPSGQNLHCAVTYDALGRMTSKQAVTTANGTPQVATTFSLPSFDATKVHAMAQAQTTDGLFSSAAQTLTYTGFDKVRTLKQGNDSIRFTYGYDHQRISMQELTPGTSRTKDYVGSCEFITKSVMGGTDSKSLTYLSGPYGVFAVVESRNGLDALHYILKDNLGSWVTITDANGTVEQQMSFDGGNRRDPQTWVNYTNNDAFEEPMFDRGFTGHEHLYSFGLVNMNGRMYDPTMSAFLSPDRYVQNPWSAQGFNRYAYCMYNPLRLTDPTGWAPRPGGGYSPDNPPPYVVIDGWTSGYLLDEVDVTSQTYEEFEYTPYFCIGGGGDIPQWSNVNNGQSNGPSGSGGGSGNHGGGSHHQKTIGETPPDGATIHTGNNLLLKAYWHYQFGKKEDFWVDASTLKLDYITQNDLSYHNGITTVNLFDHSKTAQSALTLGKIKLTPVGENLFEIHYDTYNFEIEWEYGWTTRNIGTAISGFIHGPVLDDVPLPTHCMDGKPCYAQPSVYWGGPFKIRFTNCVYIKP